MKTLLFFMFTLSLNAFASEAKVIQIQGSSAQYLYNKLTPKSENSTKCYIALKENGTSVPECEFVIYNYTENDKVVIIDGLSADELYSNIANSSQVKCFNATKEDRTQKIECELIGKVVGKNF